MHRVPSTGRSFIADAATTGPGLAVSAAAAAAVAMAWPVIWADVQCLVTSAAARHCHAEPLALDKPGRLYVGLSVLQVLNHVATAPCCMHYS